MALIPIGAYEPRALMRDQHVDPPEAVQLMLDCGAARAFGHHWGGFARTHEAPATLAAALAAHDLPLERFKALRSSEAASVAWPPAQSVLTAQEVEGPRRGG